MAHQTHTKQACSKRLDVARGAGMGTQLHSVFSRAIAAEACLDTNEYRLQGWSANTLS